MELLKSTVLKPINSVHTSPEGSFLVYDMNKGKYYVEPKHYQDFYYSYIRVCKSEPLYLTADLCSFVEHVLYFDIDATTTAAADSPYDPAVVDEYCDQYILSTFQTHFKQLHHFVMIVAMRPNHYGFHLYFPEIIVSHENYILCCEQFGRYLNQTVGDVEFRVDCPANMTLPRSRKTGYVPYAPKLVVYFEEHKPHISVECVKNAYDVRIEQIRADMNKKYKPKKDTKNSIFRDLVRNPYRNFMTTLYSIMMPKNVYALLDYHTLVYPFHITEDDFDDRTKFCHFLLYEDAGRMKQINIFVDADKLSFQKNAVNKLYQYMQKNAFKMSEFESRNRALKRWHRSFAGLSGSGAEERQDYFDVVNTDIKMCSDKYRNVQHPLVFTMEYNDCFSFLPVFYALCNYYKTNVAGRLLPLLTKPKSRRLVERMKQVSWSALRVMCSTFTKNTILYCALNYCHCGTEQVDMSEKFRHIFRQWESNIMMCDKNKNYTFEFIIRVLNYYFPFCKNAFKKHFYTWNCISNSWISFSATEVKQLIHTVYFHLCSYVKNNMDRLIAIDLTDSDLNHIVSTKSMETLFHNNVRAFNQNKWVVQTNEGLLDLFTGSLSSSVPEYYVTSLSLSIPLCKRTFEKTVNSAKYIDLERLLWREDFVNGYRDRLLSLTDDARCHGNGSFKTVLLQELRRHCRQQQQERERERERERDSDPYGDDEISDHMMEFYINVCKFLSFEADRMNCLMTFVSSIFIATNFLKSIVIFQGEKNNGKTKMFHILEKVLGTYCAPVSPHMFIKSEKRDTMCDIALNIYDKRLILVEEMTGPLSENMIKQITGNSTVSSRSIYDIPRYGVPTAKIFATTNNAPSCQSTSAFCDRIVPFHFKSKFLPAAADDDEVPASVSEQVRRHVYPAKADDRIIANSVLGLFYTSLFRLFRTINLHDGYLQLGQIPQSILDFKRDYVEIMDIYVQFKDFMDVQVVPNEITTETELRTAIRHFIKCKRISSVKVSFFMEKFDEEFNDSKFENDFCSDADDDDDSSELVTKFFAEEEASTSKKKKQQQTKRQKISVICYKDIKIKSIPK